VRPLQLTRTTLTSCLGRGLEATFAALRARASGLAPCRFGDAQLDTCIGEVAGVDEVRLEPALRASRVPIVGGVVWQSAAGTLFAARAR